MLFKKTPLRMSIDLGARNTRILRADRPNNSPFILPTVFSKAEDSSLLGNEALKIKSNNQLIWPLRHGFIMSEEDCLSYLQLLHKTIAPGSRETWVVLSGPSTGNNNDDKKLARIASKVFDQVLVVPELTLIVFAMKNKGIEYPQKMVLANIGAACIQIALINGIWPEPKEILHLTGAGNDIDCKLKDSIKSIAPELKISTRTAQNLKESFSGNMVHSTPTCLVEVVQQHRRRLLDISPAIKKAAETQNKNILRAVKYILESNNSSKSKLFGRKIILTGGGASFQGIDKTLLIALAERNFPTQKVVVMQDHNNVTVQGGLQLIKMLTPEHWKVLV